VGTLSARRAATVADASLARRARALDLAPLVVLGRGADAAGERERESVLATTLEAVLGALYLDAGLAAVRRAVADPLA
jgi:ribonuclease-3